MQSLPNSIYPPSRNALRLDCLHRDISTFKDLGSDIVGCAAHGLSSLTRMCQFGSQPEVAYTYFQIISEEEISKFEIAMNHHLILEIPYCKRNLPQVVSSFQLSNAFTALDELIKRLVGTQLQYDVDIGSILKGSLVFHHKLRSNGLMYFNL